MRDELDDDYADYRIRESDLVEWFNRVTGANVTRAEEIRPYLNQHPEAETLLGIDADRTVQ
jgi:hypothetical protein